MPKSFRRADSGAPHVMPPLGYAARRAASDRNAALLARRAASSAANAPPISRLKATVGFVARQWWVGLAAIGAVIATEGYRTWAERREPELVVRAFVEAIKAGSHSAALELMTPEHAAAARDNLAEGGVEWTPSPGMKYTIRRVQVSGDFAVVDLSLLEGGYAIKPEMVLDRDAGGQWKIAEINNLRMDPRWVRKQRQIHAEADEELAHELEKELQNLPGVVVERETGPGSRRL